MNHRRIEEMIPNAIAIIESVNIAHNGGVDSVYKGYISSFGASIIQSSLLSTVIFFESEGSEEGDRKLVPKAMLELLKKQGKINTQQNIFSEYILEVKRNYPADFETKMRKLKKDLTEVSIALKIALRTFNMQ